MYNRYTIAFKCMYNNIIITFVIYNVVFFFLQNLNVLVMITLNKSLELSLSLSINKFDGVLF